MLLQMNGNDINLQNACLSSAPFMFHPLNVELLCRWKGIVAKSLSKVIGQSQEPFVGNIKGKHGT